MQNSIVDVSALGEGLKANKTLTSLNLGRNSIADVSALEEAFKTNATLTGLVLEDNKLDRGALKALWERISSRRRDD